MTHAGQLSGSGQGFAAPHDLIPVGDHGFLARTPEGLTGPDIQGLYLDDSLEDYIVELVLATRSAERYGDELAGWIQHGASPRATMALDRCARAYAWLNNRDYVVPEDIQLLAPDVLRHRIILSFAAEAEGMTADACIEALLARVAVP